MNLQKIRCTLPLLLLSAALHAQAPKVLLVGDSWAQEQWEDQSHAVVFEANDAAQFLVRGASTTENGTTAAEWASAERLALIEQALLANPSIDTVQLTIGGNDFLDVWSTSWSEPEVTALKEAIRLDLQLITEFVLAHRPDMEVLLSFYDYPNFRDTLGGIVGTLFCAPLHNRLGQPTPLELNQIATEFEASYAQLASHPRVHHVSHAGQMQFHFGFPDDGIAPGSLLPPGDLSLPSPLASMRNRLVGRDCFHLSSAGYDHLVQNLYDQYFRVRFDTVFKSPFE